MMEKPIYMVMILFSYWSHDHGLFSVIFRNKDDTPAGETFGFHNFYKQTGYSINHGVWSKCVV